MLLTKLQCVHTSEGIPCRSSTFDPSSDEEESSLQLSIKSNSPGVAHSKPTLNVGNLGYLQDLSSRIGHSLQKSLCNRDSAEGTTSAVWRSFFEKEPSRHASDCQSTSQPSSLQLCSCLEPTVAQKIREFQETMTNFSRTSPNISLSASENEGDSVCICSTPVFPQDRSCSFQKPENVQPKPLSLYMHHSDVSNIFLSIGSHSMMDTNHSTTKLAYSAVRCIRNMQLYPCNRAFYEWLTLTRNKAFLRQKSAYIAELFRLKRLRKHFELWRELQDRSVVLNSLEIYHHNQVNSHITRSCFCVWQQRAEGDKTCAEICNQVRILTRALNQWRNHYQSVTEDKSEKVDCSVSFTCEYATQSVPF